MMDAFFVGPALMEMHLPGLDLHRGDAHRASLQVIPFSVDKVRETPVVHIVIHSIPHIRSITGQDTYN
ncbi:MAG: hypothetical protein LUF85_02600 [Bacteroides sp.]|nr:hypothetical protein [Bacteroides sp.]